MGNQVAGEWSRTSSLRRVPRRRTRSSPSRSTRRSFRSSPSTPNGDMASFAGRLRWGLDGMSRLLLPVSAAFVALALPAMRVHRSREQSSDYELLAAVLASLGVGLFTYSTFLFLARGRTRCGDSRTPAIIAGVARVVGAAVMVVGGVSPSRASTAKVARSGSATASAYFVGSLVLGVVLRARVGHGSSRTRSAGVGDLGRARRRGLVGRVRRSTPTGAWPTVGRARGDRARRTRPLLRCCCGCCRRVGAARSRVRARRSRPRGRP